MDLADSTTETICTAVVIAHKLVEDAFRWHELVKIIGDDAQKWFLADYRALEMRLGIISDFGIGPQEANKWRGLPGVPVPRDAASNHELGVKAAEWVYHAISKLTGKPWNRSVTTCRGKSGARRL